ncbi:hypothetical protein LV79_006021 [Actinokineospora globicatena]|nr:hypothetical protein [Actinokineospora globicatena]
MIVSALPDELPWTPRSQPEAASPPSTTPSPVSPPPGAALTGPASTATALSAPAPSGPAPAGPALPSPALPSPALPSPALPSPALPSPALPSPTLSGPTLSGPTLSGFAPVAGPARMSGPASTGAVLTSPRMAPVSAPGLTLEPTTVTLPVTLTEPVRGKPKWVLPVTALLVAAVVAAFVVWLISGNDDPPPVTPTAPANEYLFQRMGETVEPVRDSDCVEHAYGQVKQFLIANPCRQLTRAVFLTATDSGRTVYTSLAVVRMPDRSTAEKLELLVRQDQTGSVNDLLREKKVTVPGLDRLSRGGFSAMTLDRDVVIAESDSADRDEDPAAHKAEMKRVSVEALRLAKELG